MAILLKSACVTDLAAFPALVARSIAERSNSEIAMARSGKRLPDRMSHRSTASGATHPLSYAAVTLVGSAPKQLGISSPAAAASLQAATMAATFEQANADPLQPNQTHSNPTKGKRTMGTLTAKDGTQIYYKDWGTGQAVVFSHGWPLSADAFEDQMFFLASRGYRCIAHDRRGHGRSSQPWTGNDMDTYADDLAELVQKLGLKDAIHVGHSTGGGEVARYIARHGTKRVAKAALIASVPPLMLKTPANPGGTPIEALDKIRAGVQADRSQFWKDLSLPFYGYNRPGAKVSEGVRESFWLQGMMAGFPAAYFCIKAFSETDQTEDLKKFDVPTLIMQGDDDQIVPFADSGLLQSKLVNGATLKVYKGAPHGLCTTLKDEVNADLLAFIERKEARKAA
jgi:non-heme chloroperoxidase